MKLEAGLRSTGAAVGKAGRGANLTRLRSAGARPAIASVARAVKFVLTTRLFYVKFAASMAV